MCPEPVHTASPEFKECVVPPVLAPGASAEELARARLQDTCCAARARSRSECGGRQHAPESPIQGIPIDRTNIVQSRDTTKRFLPFHPASVIARESTDPRRPGAHSLECRAAGGRGRGRVGSPRQR